MTAGAKLIKVIVTELTKRGEGVEGDPVRIVTEYWSTEGELLAERDEWMEERVKGLHDVQTKTLHGIVSHLHEEFSDSDVCQTDVVLDKEDLHQLRVILARLGRTVG